jgi:UDP-N-acetylmuramate dehydrogenase
MGLFDDYRTIVRASPALAPHTWFRLGGPAEYLARPQSLDEIVALYQRARDHDLPVAILGGGSNILVRDEGVAGLVIHLESPAFSDVSVSGNRISAGAAVPLTALISHSARAGLAGLEVLTGIPGTVGGALRGNSGSRQGSIGQFTQRVTVLEASGEVAVREPEDLDFGYRSSNLDEPVILSAEFELEPEEPEAVVRRMRRLWIIKKEHQPYGHQSSGLIFKNPSPDLAAETLIEQAGLQGVKIGGAEVSERHANYIIAQPGATAAEVLRLIDHVRQRVWQHFGFDLELLIQVW